MGQQNYIALVWGLDGSEAEALCEAAQDDHGFWKGKNVDALAGRAGARITTSYESKEQWVGAIAAISDGCLAEWWGGAVWEYTTFPLSLAESRFAREIATARERWDKFAAAVAKKNKIAVPAGRLLLVADFD